MTAELQATSLVVFVDETEIRTPCDSSLPDPVGPEDTDDDWDMTDLDWRAEESAAMDAYERGWIFS